MLFLETRGKEGGSYRTYRMLTVNGQINLIKNITKLYIEMFFKTD